MALPILLFLLLIFTYVLVIIVFSLGLSKYETFTEISNTDGANVSIIIPFHNEIANLPLLIQDLLDQSYPRNQFEVLFVDDHSEDGSLEELATLLDGESDFSCFALPLAGSGKKAALHFGIQAAKYERIIQVDADCRVGRYFIASHMTFLSKHSADLVAGLVLITRGKGGFREAYERIDLLALAGTGAGSFALGRPMMCSGANLSYTRTLYMETRRFDPVELTESGDDMFLMIGARKLKKKLVFNTASEAIVTTNAVKSFRQLIAQRIRWGAKTPHYAMRDIQVLALLVALSNLGILLLPVWCYFYTAHWPWLTGAWLLKSLADLLLLYRISGISHQRDVLRWFVPVSLAYYPIFFISLGGVCLGRPGWKRRS